MIRLAFLLLGARAFRPQAWILAIAGAVWLALGVLILLDMRNPEIVFVLDTLAVFMAIEGAVYLAVALARGLRRHWLAALRGIGFMAAGFLVYNVEWDHNLGAVIVFGIAFLLEGLLRIGTALVLKGRRWRGGLAGGVIMLVLSLVILLQWPLPHGVTVPFCFALLLITSGYALLRLARELRQLPAGGSITSLPLYAEHNWQARGIAVPALPPEQALPTQGELHVHVWTATGSIPDPQRRLLVDRYVAAIDSKGMVSTGHSALELPPDLYVSHYPAVELDHGAGDLRAILYSGPENDVPGRFQPSLQVEAAEWCQPDRTVTFHTFNAAALRAFWQLYARDTTYNLTARNCSSTVILALDAATEGLAFRGRAWRGLLRLMLNPDFWLLRLIRGRAEAMTWTPGLVLDYATMLREVLEHADRRWSYRLRRLFTRPAGPGSVDAVSSGHPQR